MLIDWFTVIAQAINFLILIWLLKRFLYQPILNAIDAREERIATELKAAEVKKAEAQRERDLLEHNNEEFNQQRAVLLKEAMDEADIQHKQFLNEARKEADNLRAQWGEALKKEQFKLGQEITSQIQQEVFSTTRKLLTELANTKLEEQIIDVFVDLLHKQHQEIKKMMHLRVEPLSNLIQIRSSVILSSTQRVAIEKGINEIIGSSASLQFETEANLISGIEFIINGRKIAWSVTAYLDALQNRVDAFLQEQMQFNANLTSQ